MKNYIQDGETIAIVNNGITGIASGDPVVVGQQIGVALNDIPPGQTGTLVMDGVFRLPKVAAAVIGPGESVVFDASAAAFDDNAMTQSTGDLAGACTAWSSSGDGETTVLVKINTGIGTVHA